MILKIRCLNQDSATRLDSLRVESSEVGSAEKSCRVDSSRVRDETSRVEPSRLFFDSFRPLILIAENKSDRACLFLRWR
jgi:hypothetical protein